jgi:hypothetical protein
MRIVESVLSPRPENINVKSSVLWSERNVRSLKPIQPETQKPSSTLSNVLEGTVNFVRKNVLSLNTLSLFAGITCMVAVVLAVWAIYMFKEQKAKMRNLQNMVVDMSLSEAKQRNGGVSNLQINPSNNTPQDSFVNTKREPVNSLVVQNQNNKIVKEPLPPIPNEQEQMNELKKVQEEVAKLLTNPFNIVMASALEKPTSKVTIEDITNMEDASTGQITGMVQEVSEQKRRFDNMLNSYNIQANSIPKIQPVVADDDGEEADDDFLKDLELYKQQEDINTASLMELQNDLQLVAS